MRARSDTARASSSLSESASQKPHGGVALARRTSVLSSEQCKEQICEAGLKNGTRICLIETNGHPRRMVKCETKNFEFYSKCLRSCDNGDWSWMDDFNYIWE
jgi:hypothetical protein